MSLKNLLVGLLYRYKLVKQAVLNEYVKEARQRQLQYQQQIQQLINSHKADSMVKKANLLNNLYQQALLAKLAATAQNEVADDGKGALVGLLGDPGSVLGSGGVVGVPQLNSGEVDLGVRGVVRDILKGMLSRVNRGEQALRQGLRDFGRSIAEAGRSNEGSSGGGFFSETAKALAKKANENQGGLAGPSGSGKGDSGGGGAAVDMLKGVLSGITSGAQHVRQSLRSAKGGIVGDNELKDSDQRQQPDDSGSGGGGIGLPFMGLLPGQLKEKAKETAIQAWEALQKAKKDLANDSGQPDDSGLWSKVLSALNEHKGQIALGAGGGLLALLGGALLTKKLRNRKRKKNTAQTPSSDAAAAATAVEQELKDLVTSTQRQQQKKK